ncbi:unnamed protein product [Calypogeia fissa]
MAVTPKKEVAQLELPKGFRFHPTDEELVMHYLCPKADSQPFSIQIIADVDIYKFDPWDLPEMAVHGENEWYFFSPRDRKYPNGSRPNRSAGSGYWKATGTDKHISCAIEGSDANSHSKKMKKLGIKKALVFYKGKAPNGAKTNWIMHEYRLADSARTASAKSTSGPNSRRVHRKGSLRLDDWVLCRIYKKKSTMSSPSLKFDEEEERGDSIPEENNLDSSSIVEDFLAFLPEIESSKLINHLHMLPKLEEDVNSPSFTNLLTDPDLQSTGSVVLDYSPTDDLED